MPSVSLRSLETKLATLRCASWLPSELIDLVSRVSGAQYRAEAALDSAASAFLVSSIKAGQWRNGASLLPRAEFPYAQDRAEVFLRTVQALLSRLGGPLRQAALTFKKLKAGGKITAQALFTAHLHEDAAWFSNWESVFPEAPRFLSFLAQTTLSPFTHAASLHLGERQAYEPSVIWTHGHCPYCGSAPFMGELRGKEGARWHSCSFCLADFRAKRVQCPFCLEEDQQKLAIFNTDTEPGYAVHICRSCTGYIKLADFRAYEDRPFVPALDDLLSLPLDILARQQAFVRPTPSAWGF